MDRMTPGQRTLSTLWAAFLMAGVLEMVVFALVDPGDLRWLGGSHLELEPRAVYTLAFFVFWAVLAIGGALTLLLCRDGDAVAGDDSDAAQGR